MNALEVKVNGKRVCLAGNQSGSFTYAMVTVDERQAGVKTNLLVSGMRDGNVAIWEGDLEIAAGAEISIRTVSCDEEDGPSQLNPFTPPPWFPEDVA